MLNPFGTDHNFCLLFNTCNHMSSVHVCTVSIAVDSGILHSCIR